jgi:hypothetical protein
MLEPLAHFMEDDSDQMIPLRGMLQKAEEMKTQMEQSSCEGDGIPTKCYQEPCIRIRISPRISTMVKQY